MNLGGIQFFKNTCARVNFFLPEKTYFVQTVFFVQSFFFLVETVTEISGSQFFKDHILTNVTDFLTSGNHFFPFSSDSSQLLSVEAVYSSTEAYFFSQSFISASEIKFFCYWKQHCFIVRFFLLAEIMIEMRGQSIFKEEPLATNFFQKCFKVETAFPYSGNIFFNIFHPASGNKFCAYWKQYFFGQSYFAASRNHYWN